MTSHTTFLLPNPHTPVTLFLPKNLSTLKPRPKVNPLSTEEPLNPQAPVEGYATLQRGAYKGGVRKSP